MEPFQGVSWRKIYGISDRDLRKYPLFTYIDQNPDATSAMVAGAGLSFQTFPRWGLSISAEGSLSGASLPESAALSRGRIPALEQNIL